MADLEITVTIPDQHTARAMNTINGLAGKEIELNVSEPDFRGDGRLSFEPKQAGETNKDFAQRVIAQSGRS